MGLSGGDPPNPPCGRRGRSGSLRSGSLRSGSLRSGSLRSQASDGAVGEPPRQGRHALCRIPPPPSPSQPSPAQLRNPQLPVHRLVRPARPAGRYPDAGRELLRADPGSGLGAAAQVPRTDSRQRALHARVPPAHLRGGAGPALRSPGDVRRAVRARAQSWCSAEYSASSSGSDPNCTRC
jgi:hypothetical protein